MSNLSSAQTVLLLLLFINNNYTLKKLQQRLAPKPFIYSLNREYCASEWKCRVIVNLNYRLLTVRTIGLIGENSLEGGSYGEQLFDKV